MEEIYLKSNEVNEENILTIIKAVRDLERETMLKEMNLKENEVTEEVENEIAKKISHKYMHGDCSCLASLIRLLLPGAKCVLFGNDATFQTSEPAAHYCVMIRPKLNDKSAGLSGYLEKSYFFDINGKKSYDEMCEFLGKEFGVSPQETIFTGFAQCSSYNDITNQLFNLIKLPGGPRYE